MKDIQQLIKKNSQEGRYEDIFPKTFIDAVLDKESGVTLTDILAMFNMLFLSYNGSRSQTRLQVPSSLRREGLWVTYVLYDKTVVTEWYSAEAIDDTTFGDSANWRDGSNALVGDISISSDGYWVINGEVTNIKAQGEAGITPILRVGSNNHLQVSYTNGSSYVDVSSNPVFTQFRVSNNKLQQSTDLGESWSNISEELAYKFRESGNKIQMSKDLGNTWEDVSDYIAAWFRFTGTTGSSQADNVGKIQISRDNGATWSDLSGEFTNSLHIKGYVATVDTLPSTAVQGDIYGVGPTYDPSDTEHTNPIYQLYVKNSTGWVNNGRFTSISAGVVQEFGNSESAVISQKVLSENKICFNLDVLVPNPSGSYYTLETATSESFQYFHERGLVRQGLSFTFKDSDISNSTYTYVSEYNDITPFTQPQNWVKTANSTDLFYNRLERLILLKDGFPKYKINKAYSFWNALLGVKVRINSDSPTNYIYDIAYFNNNSLPVGSSYAFIFSRRLPEDTTAGETIAVQNPDWSSTGIHTMKKRGLFGGEVDFEITIDLDKLPDNGLYFISTNHEQSNFTGYSFINPANYEYSAYKNSSNYEIDSNKNLDYPMNFTDDAPTRLSGLGSILNAALLNIEVYTSKTSIENSYELAYLNRTTTNTGSFDNTVGIVRRNLSNPEDWEVQYFRRLLPLLGGKSFDVTWRVSTEETVRVFIDASDLGFTNYIISNHDGDPFSKKMFLDERCYNFVPQSSNVNPSLGTKYVKLTDSDLYVSCKVDSINDLIYHFRKCMANNLYTFYEVYTVPNNSPYPTQNVENIGNLLNRATSDNIGPIQVPSEGGGSLFVGGNHTTTSCGNIVLTAKTDSFKILIDGIEVSLYDGYSNKVCIFVSNTIYDPTSPIMNSSGCIIGFSSPLCIENVTYNIENGSIGVNVTHDFKNTAPKDIIRYYGMQSMFVNETSVMTPLGEWADFTKFWDDADNQEITFSKEDYPDFDTFIERNSYGFQASYLMPNGLGNHDKITPSEFIFRRSSSKLYHHLVENYSYPPDSIHSWSGAYIWFVEPYINNDNVLCFTTIINGSRYLFLFSKKSFTNYKITLPQEVVMKDFKLIKGVNLTFPTYLDSSITLNSTGSGEVIVKIND